MDASAFDAILTRVADGEPLRRMLREHSIQWKTWTDWLAQGDNERRYARAKETAMDALADEILDIADNGANDWMEQNHGETASWRENGEAMRRSALRIDSRKWLMAKLAPKKYGDKVTLAGDAENPLQIVSKDQRDAAVAAAIRADR